MPVERMLAAAFAVIATTVQFTLLEAQRTAPVCGTAAGNWRTLGGTQPALLASYHASPECLESMKNIGHSVIVGQDLKQKLKLLTLSKACLFSEQRLGASCAGLSFQKESP